MVTGKTKNLGIIGFPVEHSLSPCMQNAALEKAGLNYIYIAMPVEPAKLKEAVTGLKSLAFEGVNVTIPHKIAIMPLLDCIDENARMIGAVNTVIFEDGLAKGYNTDAVGFVTSLKNNGVGIAGGRAVMLGAGGAARAVVWGLIQENIASIAIGARNTEKAQVLADVFRDYIEIKVYDWRSPEFGAELRGAALLVNSTPLGMSPKLDEQPPVDWEQLSKTAVVYDLIYNPTTTGFLKTAAQRGHTVINGEEMLVEQGAASFAFWTKVQADSKVMLDKLREVNKK